MIRLREHILQEKIKGSNVKASLNDDKLMIGMEFEYVDHGVAEAKDWVDGVNMSELAYSYYRFTDKLKALAAVWEEEQAEFLEEIEKTWRTNIIKKRDIWYDLVNEKDIIEIDIQKYDAQIEEIHAIINLEIQQAAMNGEMAPDNKDAWKEIDKLQKASKKASNKLIKISPKVATVEEDVNTLDNYNGDWTSYAEELGLDYYVDGRLPKMGEAIFDFIDEDLFDFWKEHDGLSKPNIFNEVLWTYVYDGGGHLRDIYEQLTDPDDILDRRGFEDWIRDGLNSYDLPFDIDDAIIGDYHGSTDYTKWRIEEDSSLEEHKGGIEIISPTMPIKEGVKVLKKMFDYIKKNGETVQDCGFHMHLSHADFGGRKFAEVCDLLKVMLFTEEGYIFKEFDEREDNTFCKSMLQQLDDNFTKSADSYDDMVDYSKLMKTTRLPLLFKKMKSVMPYADHFNGINWEGWRGKNPHIEFRYLGGTDYERKEKEVLKVMGSYGFLIRLGIDEELRKKEYIKKLWRLFNTYKGDESKQGDPLQARADIQLYKKISRGGKQIGGSFMKGYEKYWSYKGKVYRVTYYDAKTVDIKGMGDAKKFHRDVKRGLIKDFTVTLDD